MSGNYKNISFHQLDLFNGLPNNTVTAIAQDANGFMWFGTRNGLARYDGYKMKSYFQSTQVNDLPSGFINHIFCLEGMPDFWISTAKGIVRYDSNKDQFNRYCHPRTHKPINARKVFLSSRKEILIATANGILKYDGASNSIISYITPHLNVMDCVEDASGNLWMATKTGLHCYNIHTGSFVRDILPVSEASHLIQTTQCVRLLLDKYGRLWIKTETEGVFVVLFDKGLVEPVRILKNELVRCLMEDEYGNVWAGTENGIFIIDYQLECLRHVYKSPTDRSNLNDNPIYSLYRDNSDNIWVGTYFGGVNLSICNNRYLSLYLNQRDVQLNGKAIRKILPLSQQKLLIASEDGGLSLYDRENDLFISRNALQQQYGVKEMNIHALLSDQNQHIWIGTFAHGLYHYDVHTGRSKYIPIESMETSNYSCFDLAEDSYGNIWCATTLGLFQYDVLKKKLFSPSCLSNLNPAFIFKILSTKDGFLWIGCRHKGLYKLDIKHQSLSSILLSGKLEDDFISALFEDSQDRLWVGTNSDGMFVSNTSKTMFTSIPDSCAGHQSIKDVIEDNNGNIWFGTDNGLGCLDTKMHMRFLTLSNGLPIQQFNYNSACKMADGELFFGTIKGMVSFYPNHIEPEKVHFPVHLTDIYINEKTFKEYLGEGVAGCKELRLPYADSRSLIISYSGLNYHYGVQTQYAIQLEGSDDNWRYVNTQSQILFSNLSPGKYTLRIKAGSNGVDWDEASIYSLKIVILAPWWRSWWAYLIYGILLMGLFLLIYHYVKSRIALSMQLHAEHNDRLKIEELNQQKMNFFTYLSHDLKTPLTLILSPLERIINNPRTIPQNKESLRVILRNALRMQRLIEDLKTFSQIEMKQQKIRIRKGDILLFLKETTQIFDMLSKERNIDFAVEIQPSQIKDHWFSPSKLERIVYNLLSNAFKYTPDGGMITFKAFVEITSKGNECVIVVQDTGCGFPQELAEKIFDNYYQVNKNDCSTGTGVGLALTRMLVHLHHGVIQAQSKPGVGSTFTVRICISDTAFETDELSDVPIELDAIEKYNLHMRESVEILDMNRLSPVRNLSQRQKVLIVEDNIEMNQYLAQIMSEHFDVITAFNGNEGIKNAFSEAPDLIISDVMMPETDGLTLVHILKNDIITAHIPIILLTAKTEEEQVTEGYKQGADVYVTKPFNATNLELQVKNLMRTRATQIKHFHQNEESQVSELVSNPHDEKFMEQLMKIIMDNLDNAELTVTDITSELCISRSLLHNKIKGIANMSITEFVRSVRMKEAKKLLYQEMNVSEVAYAVGISDPNYFTKCFKKQFEITPSEYIRSIRPAHNKKLN